MTTLPLFEARPRPTSFERMLLRAAAAADRHVALRLARHDALARRTRAREHAADARRSAEALGAFGVLPR
ncbi:hypothetical protein P0L94_04330 [Microbacter sp. GSS18]|nr:hypothetical protein P0L94_04330 [Microbacter sp. GSS18]